MTQIDFYVDSASPFDTVFQLCQKARQRNWKVRVVTRSEEENRRLDRYLWEHPQLAFLPHCLMGDALQHETPIWIGTSEEHEGEADVLINLNPEVPRFFAQFLRLAEVVGKEDPELKQAGRERYRYYQQRGYPIQVHNLGTLKK